MRVAICKPKIRRSWLKQQDTDPKSPTKAASETQHLPFAGSGSQPSETAVCLSRSSSVRKNGSDVVQV